MEKDKLTRLTETATQVRRDLLRMIHAAKSGHPGGSLGCTDLLVALYFEVMRIDPSKFNIYGDNEDIFLLSNGHVVPAWYSVLARRGYFDIDELATFRNMNSRLQGHPAVAHGLPGIRFASGSLGQGLSCATGIALAKHFAGDDKLVYVLLGDGELQEGQVWESIMFCGNRKVDNLIAIVDVNGEQIDGSTKDIIGFDALNSKFDAFGWRVLDTDGNDIEKLIDTIHDAISTVNQPTVILMHTDMGSGVDFMMGSNEWHGKAPNDDELALALAKLPETLGDW